MEFPYGILYILSTVMFPGENKFLYNKFSPYVARELRMSAFSMINAYFKTKNFPFIFVLVASLIVLISD